MNIASLYQIFLQHSSIATDTRKIKKGDIFFALKGPNFNGNNFAIQALNAGAAYVVSDEEVASTHNRILKFNDALQTLQQLAKHHRQQFNIPFIAITGSNGKTTTKELVHAVLSSFYITYTTEGNLNNHIGIPLTILKIKKDAQLAVIEMGANRQKEIESYCQYAMPTHGMITNFGKAHLEGFGGVEGVIKGKSELFNYLKENKGTAFINADEKLMKEKSKGIKEIITYGTNNASTKGSLVNSSTFLQMNISGNARIDNLHTHLVGEYNLPNVLAAVSIGKYFSVPDEKIKTAIENYIPANSRSQMIKKETNTIILDAYNANPTSMKAAIENFAKMEGSNKILMLGGMMELGEESTYEHEQIINCINQHQWNNVVLVGPQFKETTNKFIRFENSLEAAEWFRQQHLNDSSVLIKGSRSMAMEKIIE